MKTAKRVIPLVLAIIMVMSFFVVSASAANTTDTVFSRIAYTYAFYGITARAKEDSSPIYLYIDAITDGSTNIWVQAKGRNTLNSPEATVNCTYKNGAIVGYVTCRKGVDYSVHNLIYENGYPYATLAFRNFEGITSTTVRGTWSADSYGTYTDP